MNELHEIIVNEESVGDGGAHEAKGAVLGVAPPEGYSSDDEQYVDQRNHFDEKTFVDETDGYDLREGRQQELLDRVLHYSRRHQHWPLVLGFNRIHDFGLHSLRDDQNHVEKDPRNADRLVAEDEL